MQTVVPMRRPNATLQNYNNKTSFIREFELPIGVTVSVLSWMVLADYYGAIVLGMFAVVSLTGYGIGKIKHYKQPSLVLSCVPASEAQHSENEEQIRKAA
jgi:hypothetical protein